MNNTNSLPLSNTIPSQQGTPCADPIEAFIKSHLKKPYLDTKEANQLEDVVREILIQLRVSGNVETIKNIASACLNNLSKMPGCTPKVSEALENITSNALNTERAWKNV